MNNLVSSVITTYKREPSIVVRAITSVLAQTYKNIEIIVVDDSPVTYQYRDKVKEEINKLSDNIIYIRHKEPLGACAARNTGLKVAKGKYIGYLDDDDEWLSQKVEKQVKRFEELDDSFAIVYCGSILCNEQRGLSVSRYPVIHEDEVFNSLIDENYIGGASYPLIRTDHLREIGGFDLLMESAQDADVWLRLAEKYKIACVNEPLVKYYIHDGEQIATNPKKKLNGLKRIYEKNKQYFLNNQKSNTIINGKIAALYAWNGNILKSLSEFYNNFKNSPIQIRLHFLIFLKIVKRYYMCVKSKLFKSKSL